MVVTACTLNAEGRTLHDPSGSPLSGFHSHTMPSMPPLASIFASGDHASVNTQFLCPCAVLTPSTHALVFQRRVGGFGTCQALAFDDVVSTGGPPWTALCGAAHKGTLSVCSGVPVARSHNRKVVSPEPLAMYLPLELNCTDSTASACPVQSPLQWFQLCMRGAMCQDQGTAA